ncbi:MAG: hypothetical protein U5K77_02470 [Candidatus Saccharibacteria bacterium]|nr:hypothetical protein [Candidatus Saccharibacteria bacterium]
MSGTSQDNQASKKPKRRIGLWVVIGLLLVIGINGGIKGVQRGNQRAAQSAATRAGFMQDCVTDPESAAFCVCLYDTMGEQAMLEAYDRYKATNEYNNKFKAVAADCTRLEQAD